VTVLSNRGTAYAKISKIYIVAAYATSPGIQKQKRVTQSHPGPLRPDHRQQRLCPRPGPDTETSRSEGSTAQETTEQYVKSHPQNSSTCSYRYGPLHEGASFNITRLTTLKSLCEDATAATRFALHLAQLTYKRMQEKACPFHLDPQQWEYYKQVVDEAIRQMQRYIEHPTPEAADLVQAWLSDVRALQNTYRNQAWGPVRIIHSTEVLLIEYALSCLLQPTASADWGLPSRPSIRGTLQFPLWDRAHS
jgi:hypothetical protein